jgi:hypothetical protein
MRQRATPNPSNNGIISHPYDNKRHVIVNVSHPENSNPPGEDGASGQFPEYLTSDWNYNVPDDLADFDVFNMNSLFDARMAEQLMDFNY